MSKNKQGSGKAWTEILKSISVGTLVGALSCIVLLGIMAFVLKASGILPREAFFVLTLFAAGVGAFVSGFVTSKMYPYRGFLYGSASALLMTVLFMICGAILTAEPFSALTVTKMLVMILCGAIGGVLGVNRRKGTHAKRHRH